jgi:hypothetical protein
MRKELIQFYRENKVAVWVTIVLMILAIVTKFQN